MSRLRRVVDPSKLVPGAAGTGRSRAANFDTPGDEVADAFQRMVESRVAGDGIAGHSRREDPPVTERDVEVMAPVSVEDADEIEAMPPDAALAEPPAVAGGGEEPPIKTDEDLDACDPVAAATDPLILDPNWRISEQVLPNTPQVEGAPAEAPAAAGGTSTTGWTRLEPGALGAVLGKASQQASLTQAVTVRPVSPQPLGVPVEPEPPAGQGIRGLVAALGGKPTSAPATPDTNLLASLPPIASTAATSWADVLRQKGAQRVQSSSGSVEPAEAKIESVTAPPPGAGTEGARAPAAAAPSFQVAEPAPPTPSAPPQGSGARGGGRPATPDGMLSTPDDQPPGAMRLRVPTRGGEMVRGNLQVNAETRAVRLTLAPQDGETARSMATAREMLRSGLADDGYKLQDYTVRHEGRSLFRQPSESQAQGNMQSDAGQADDEATTRDDTQSKPRRRAARGQTDDDPVVAGWFV